MQIPITPIDLNLIRQMNAARMTDVKTTNDLGLFAKPTSYKLGVGDVLQITVWDHPELAAALGQPAQNAKTSDAAPGFVVDSDGEIQFPYITKPIHAQGKSAEQVQREIYADLSKVFVKPQITVRVESFRSSQVYVDGDVRAPGAQTINDIPMTLTEAVNRSGGFAPSADQSRVTIIRNGTSYPINMADMIARGKNPSEIMLQPGDMLHVSSREDNTVYVMGEVECAEGCPAGTQWPSDTGRSLVASRRHECELCRCQVALRDSPRQRATSRKSITSTRVRRFRCCLRTSSTCNRRMLCMSTTVSSGALQPRALTCCCRQLTLA